MDVAIRRAMPPSPDRTGGAALTGHVNSHAPHEVIIDPFRTILFPNAVREKRQGAGIRSLLALSGNLPDIPYVRLSKIERGEVFARVEELQAIAAALNVSNAADLLIDVEAPSFSVEEWAHAQCDIKPLNREAEELAVLLAAAFRARRARDPKMTLAHLQQEYQLPTVIVFRIENAVKPFDRWNSATLGSICALLGQADRDELVRFLRAAHESGRLTEWLTIVPGAEERERRTCERVRALRKELALLSSAKQRTPIKVRSPQRAQEEPPQQKTAGQLQVMGVPVGGGLIAPSLTQTYIERPPSAGANAYALRMCRASLGGAIPGNAILIVDPERCPVDNGLLVLREDNGLRVLIATTERDGRLHGHSLHPAMDIALDTIEPSKLAKVTNILFP